MAGESPICVSRHRFLALTFILVWFCPTTGGRTAGFCSGVDAGDHAVVPTPAIPSSAWCIQPLLPEVAETDGHRNQLQISSSLFAMLGTVLGFVIPDMVRPKTGDASLVPLYVAVIVAGIFGMLMILVTTFKVKEKPEFTKVDKPISLWEAIKFTFTQ